MRLVCPDCRQGKKGDMHVQIVHRIIKETCMSSQDKKRQETCMSSLGSLRKDCRQGKKKEICMFSLDRLRKETCMSRL